MSTARPADNGDTNDTDDFTPPRGVPLAAEPTHPVGHDAPAEPTRTPGPGPLPPPTAQRVTAVIVTNGLTPYLRPLLVSLMGHDVLPGRILIADVSAESSARLPEGMSYPVTPEIIAVPGAKTFGVAVSRALEQGNPPVGSPWLWLLHDDTIVHHGALAAQLAVVEYSASVQVIGAKHVRYGAPSDLLDVGYSVAPGGRRFTGIEPGEYDQGQHDGREDVYAVGLNGALVSHELWRTLNGTDPAYGRYGDSLEFCRRARLHGARVVVAPAAVIEHAQASLMGLRDSNELHPSPRPTVLDDHLEEPTFRVRLTTQRLFAATDRPLILYPFFWLLITLMAPLRALARVTRKQPRRAVNELGIPIWLIGRTGSVIAGRRRIAASRTVPASVLRPMRVSLSDLTQFYRDRRLARAALRKQLYGLSELDRREVRAIAAKRRSMFITLITMLTIATAVALRDLLPALTGQGRILGGALVTADGGWADLWRTWTSGWVRDGLGASAPADPLIQTLTPITTLAGGNLQLAVHLTMLGALIASGIGAWFAAGTISRSVVIRLWASLLWVASPAFLMAYSQGRLGAIIAHSALPWLIVAVMRAAGVHRRDQLTGPQLRHEKRADALLREKLAEQDTVAARPAVTSPTAPPRKSLAAVGGAALVFAVVCAGAPVLLIPGIIALIIAAIASKTRALLVVPIPALALLGPLLFRAIINIDAGGWRILVADPGAAYAYDTAPTWQQVLGVPIEHTIAPLTQGWGAVVLSLLPFVLGATLLIGALLAFIRRGHGARGVRFAWILAIVGYATALLSSDIVIAAHEGQYVHGWSGAGLSLMLVGLLGACVCAADGLAGKTHQYSFGWRQIGLGIAATLVLVVPIGTIAMWAPQRTLGASEGVITYLDESLVPAVAQQMQESGRQARVLIVDAHDADHVSYQLLHHDGPHMFETSTVVNVAQLAGRPDDIADLVAHVSRGIETQEGPALAFSLAAQGIGSVFVPGDNPSTTAQLVSRIDRVAGIERITTSELGTLWRVNPTELDPALATAPPTTTTTNDDTPEPRITIVAGEPAWAVLYEVGTDTQGDDVLGRPQALNAGTLSVNATLPEGQGERLLVLAENAAPGWQATLNGRPLTATQVAGMQGFNIPASATEGQRVTVTYERSSRLPWLIGQSLVLLVFVLLAVPVRRRGEVT
ncbi:glycosyltransferase family 2 protein [Jonesia quinghaiensis]|uniref:glycosyltransferase family 2 protein n=1 Tax=Jonesia quinghaiensis TaxID=262806 RepID=UPI00040E22E6|nr:glycosyltransferase [Jonesia quinghaiensis]